MYWLFNYLSTIFYISNNLIITFYQLSHFNLIIFLFILFIFYNIKLIYYLLTVN